MLLLMLLLMLFGLGAIKETFPPNVTGEVRLL